MAENHPPDAGRFLAALGKPLEAIDAAVFSYADRPDFSLPERSPIGGIFFKQHGLSITFCPPDFYHANEALAGGPAIITNVQLYSGDPEYHHQRHAGPLPHGLTFDDSRDAVVARLGASAWQFPLAAPFTLERWDVGDHWLLVRYAGDGSGIGLIEVGLKPGKPKRSVLPAVEQPDIHTLQYLFEQPWRDVAAHPAMAGVDFAGLAHVGASDTAPHELDELRTRGVELYFRPSRNVELELPAYVLSGARYVRKGVYGSRGFDGALPRGIRFEDTPEQVLRKVGVHPVTGSADALTGYYAWKLPEFMLHVGFSVMEQRVNRIRVAAHPYYASAVLESPLLKAPA